MKEFLNVEREIDNFLEFLVETPVNIGKSHRYYKYWMVQTSEILMLQRIANLARIKQEVDSKYGCRISVSVKNKQRRHLLKLPIFQLLVIFALS